MKRSAQSDGGEARSSVAVAQITRPHGLRGELKLHVYNPSSDLLAKPRARGRGAPEYQAVQLRMPDGAERGAVISSARPVPGGLLVTLEGVGDRDAAEALRGAELVVSRDALPDLDDGEFYACDLEGARAVLKSGEEIGRVTGVQSYPTCDALIVDRGAGKARLEIPLVDAYVASVDAANGLVELVTVEGLE